VRDVSLWSALLGVEKSVIESIEFVADSGVVVAHVRPKARARGRCGRCRRRCRRRLPVDELVPERPGGRKPGRFPACERFAQGAAMNYAGLRNPSVG